MSRISLCVLRIIAAVCTIICAIYGSVAPLWAFEPVKEIRAGFVYVAPVGDAGWNWAHDEGRKALEKLPFVKKTRFVENVKEGADATRVMTQFAEMGFNLIFATSYGYMDPCEEAAKNYPKTVFMHCSGSKRSANMSNYFGRMYQARYLTGIVAGKMTKKNEIGYVAAHPIPEVIRGINAFTLGVRSVNPKAKVRVVWTYTWFDPAKEKEAAESLIEVGADVIAQHQDSPGPQQAAQEHGVWSIGYNTDMSRFAPKAHLTSAVWNWVPLYTKIATDLHEGKWTDEPIWWGIETGIVDIAPLGPMVPEEVKKLVMEKKREIAEKKLVVFRGPVRDQEGKTAIPDGKTPTDRELYTMSYFVEGVEGKIPK
jgi:basic membrane protein A